MSKYKTFAKLQYNHLSYIAIVLWNLVRVIYQNLWEDARFLYIILNNRNPVLTEKIEIPNQIVQVNNYHTRYQDSYRGADGETIDELA